MAASAASRAIFTSRAADVSPKTNFPPLSRHLLIRPFLRNSGPKRATMCCLISGVDGGGVSDEFISTRKLSFGREFSVIANMLKRIEPLDTSMISRGVSDSAKDSMKQTISTMLGLLPSDQFSITVQVSKQPLDRLIVSSIVTGYTLWNTEYRTSLMRIFDRSPDSLKRSDFTADNSRSEVRWEEFEGEESEKGVVGELEGCGEVFEKRNLQNIGKLSPEALTYIQKLESELSVVKKELYARRRQNLQLEQTKRSDNDLLEYLRSLESDTVAELSRPSSTEVEEIIHQLAQNTMHVFFKEETASDYLVDSAATSIQNYQKPANTKFCDTICTSRDYLAKLLFWCMLLGHHLRGLENRLHLSCAVGLL
ncbi:uncharacterized protein LOC142549817 [Primulina tabacum]|uniref:uncharacterized protein LOC142549817 n=1 Tax=Primulina tabacum TaxID=48773 RepID=UPI003F5A7B6A